VWRKKRRSIQKGKDLSLPEPGLSKKENKDNTRRKEGRDEWGGALEVNDFLRGERLISFDLTMQKE